MSTPTMASAELMALCATLRAAIWQSSRYARLCLVTEHVAMIGRFRMVRPQARQISPDKNVNCRYTTAAFTLSPESRALSCVADLPRDWALYAASVRRLIALHSGFLQTSPHGSALAVG